MNNTSGGKLEKVDLLFIGNLEHAEEALPYSARRLQPKPHCDEILFRRAAKVQLLRIVRPKREIYKKYHSVTQSEKPIRNFEVFYRNLAESESRYSLLSRSDELLANSNDDILITAREGVYTDILVVRGFFTKITLCVYGYLLKEETVREKCPSFGCDVKVERPLSLPQTGGEPVRSQLLQSMLEAVQQGSCNLPMDYVDAWFEGGADDDQTQIRHISDITHRLQQSLLALSQVRLPSELVQFRNNLEQLHSELSKLIRTKHLGLYYPTPFRPSQLPRHLPDALPNVLLKCFQLHDSDKFRALENLRLLLQLPDMATSFISAGGMKELFQMFVAGESSFSTMKILLLEVLLVLAQFTPALRIMTEAFVIDQSLCDFVLLDDERSSPPAEKQGSVSRGRADSRSRSRDKKRKDRSSNRSKDRSKEKSRDRKKKESERKDKKKRKYSDDSDESREKKKGKGKKEKKEKDGKDKKSKDDKRSRSKSTDKRKRESTELQLASAKKKAERFLTFYQILLLQLQKEQPYKQSVLLKLLVQQITQAITRDSRLSDQLAVYSPLLREIRFLFNPSRELVNPKALKIFASFEPVLNMQQSEGVEDCRFVSDVLKVANPKKFGLDIMLHKVINTVSCKIAFSEFDQEFILCVSELILSDSVTTIGLNRVVEALKNLNLRRNEAALVMLMDYLYKVLLEDEGMTTVLYLDQIFSALLPISKALREQRMSSFSRELSRSTKFLINYASIFDYFVKENILKSLSENFLKIFRYVHIEASKFLEYEQVQVGEQKPLNLTSLRETFNLGNFYELLPEQPLLELDCSLKVFVVLCRYNRNIWTSYYEHKLTNGFAVLFNRMCYLLSFMLTKTVDMEYASTELQHRSKLISGYLDVINRLLMLFVDKTRYESAFNELQAEDEQDDVELLTVSLQLYRQVFAAYFDPELRVTGAARPKVRRTLELIAELYYQFCEGVDLSRNKQRERKLKRLLDRAYIAHFQSISHRAAGLSFFVMMLQVTRRSAREQILQQHLFGKFEFQYDIFESELSLVPSNDRPVLENLIKCNLYRSDVTVRAAMVQLLRTILADLHYANTLALYRFFDGLIRELTLDLKTSSGDALMCRIPLDKLILLLEVFHSCCSASFKHFALASQLDEQLIKLLRLVEEVQAEAVDSSLRLGLVKVRNQCLRLFETLIDCTVSLRPEGPHVLGFDTPSVQVQHVLFKLLNDFIHKTAGLFPEQADLSPQLRCQMLKSCELSLQVCLASCRSLITQTVLLYGEYLENAYRPDCAISLEVLFRLPSINLGDDRQTVLRIVEMAVFLLIGMTQNPAQGYYNCQRRKVAIKSLLGAVSFSDVVQKLPLPQAYGKFLENYFSMPSQEIKLAREGEQTRDLQEALKQAREQREDSKKGSLDRAFDNLSGTLLDIITEGEQPARARYLLVCPPWIGGDYRNIFDPLSAIDCKKHVDTLVAALEQKDQIVHATTYELPRSCPPTEFNELVLLYTKKQYPQRVKKPSPWSLNLKHVPLELKAPADEPLREMIKPVTASTVYTKPSYLVTSNAPATVQPYANYASSANAFQTHTPSASAVQVPKYSSPAHQAPMNAGHHEPRGMGHGMDMARSSYDMMYYQNSAHQPHQPAPSHPSYYGASSYGSYNHLPQAAKRQPTQEQQYMMMYQMQQQQQQQEMLRRQEMQRSDLNTAYQRAKKLLQVIYNKDADGESRHRAESDLGHLMGMYPDLQKMLRDLK